MICRVSKNKVYRNKSPKCCRAEKKIQKAQRQWERAHRRHIPTPYAAVQRTGMSRAMIRAKKAVDRAIREAARKGC